MVAPRDLIPARGRPGKVFIMSVERQLTAEDLYRLATEPKQTVALAPLQKLRASHHAIARYLASGKTARETAILVGCTAQRVGDLTRDPSFNHLLDYYREQINESGIVDAERAQAKLRIAAETATDLIQERLEDETKSKDIPIGELRQIAAFGYDRTVAPPKVAVSTTTPPVNVTFNMGPRDIRQNQPKDAKIIDQDDETK